MTKTTRSIERALRALRVVEQSDGVSLQQVAAKVGIPKPTTLRILKTLIQEDYVVRSEADGRYRQVLRVSNPDQVVPGLVLETARRHIDVLCKNVVWPAQLGICDGQRMRIIYQHSKTSLFTLNGAISNQDLEILPSALGRAYLAFCQEEERATILNRLGSGKTWRPSRAARAVAVGKLIETIRQSGYALREPGYQPSNVANTYSFKDFGALAVPILVRGAAVAAVNLMWVSTAISETAFVNQYLPALLTTAEKIGAELDKLSR